MISTAIPYANGAPHIGHAYERIATDAIARFKRLDGHDVFFITGMDEYGLKVQQTASREGVTPQALARAPTLTFSDKDQLQTRWVSRHLKQQRQALPTHRMASSQAFVDACLTGLGWGLNPEALVARHLASGALVELIPDTPLDVALHWQFTRLAAPALAPVTAALRTAAVRWLVPPA